MTQVTCRKLTLVIPGLDQAGSYDEERIFPLLSNWLRRHAGTAPGLPDPPIYVGEGKARAYRIFFLDGKEVAAMLTLSIYFDAASPTGLAGLVTDAYWGDVRDIKPLLEVLTTVGTQVELGSIIVPSREATHQRQFAMMGYAPHVVVIFSGESLTDPAHYYRIFLPNR